MEKCFNESSEKFCQVVFSSELLLHEIDLRPLSDHRVGLVHDRLHPRGHDRNEIPDQTLHLTLPENGDGGLGRNQIVVADLKTKIFH